LDHDATSTPTEGEALRSYHAFLHVQSLQALGKTVIPQEMPWGNCFFGQIYEGDRQVYVKFGAGGAFSVLFCRGRNHVFLG
jgi:hypothetical protein